MKPVGTTCPITKVALLLSDTWTMLIMHELIARDMRFCELERALEGISTRTLTNKLHTLEEEALLTKTESGYYSATKQGKGLKLIENAMRKYEKTYLS